MFALSLMGPRAIEPVDLPYPVARDGEALVWVDLVGICGSELHDARTLQHRQPPVVMGHEIVGRLEDGARVAVNPLIACGACLPCLAGRSNVCTSRQVLGIHRSGGFATMVVVPVSQLNPIPPTLESGQAVMAEPLGNGIHAWNLSGASESSRIGILGAGPIGLSVALAAVTQGAAAVEVIEPVQSRRTAASALGVDVPAELGNGYDVVFDCVGTVSTHRASVEGLANGGTAVWLGLMDRGPGFDAGEIVRAEKAVRGSYGYTNAEFSQAVRLAGKVPPSWVDARPLSEGPAVFESLWRGEILAPKVALRPDVLEVGK